MNYQRPTVSTYPSSVLEEFAGPVETQYITDLRVPDRFPSNGQGAEVEFCFNYVSEGCEGGEVRFGLIHLGEPAVAGAQAEESRALYPAQEGENCISVMQYGCGPYALEVYVVCDGEKTNVLTDKFFIECDN